MRLKRRNEMKILALKQVVYEASYGYKSKDIFFEVSDIVCVQDSSLVREFGDECQIWLKGMDDFFVVMGTAKKVIEKIKNVKEIL